jgi:hypothetical protein
MIDDEITVADIGRVQVKWSLERCFHAKRFKVKWMCMLVLHIVGKRLHFRLATMK